MKIVNYDENGQIVGIYDEELHGVYDEVTNTYDTSSIPKPNVSVDDEVAEKIVSGEINTYQNGDFVYVDYSTIEDKKRAINLSFESKMEELVNQYPKAEQSTWDIQQYEAMQYLQTKDETVAPLLSEVLTGEPDGTTMEDLCNRVLAKAVPFKKIAGQLLAEKNKALRELEAE